MSAPWLLDEAEAGQTFCHEAFFYAGEAEFVRGMAAFVRQGLESDEAVLVVVPRPKIDLLRGALGDEARAVGFEDMMELGRNPARILPAWQRFVSEHSVRHRRARGIGEPVGAYRSPAELVECHRHESLLNVAFAQTPGLRLMCPYDTLALDSVIIDEARRTHPFVLEGGHRRRSVRFRPVDPRSVFDHPLPWPGTQPVELRITSASLGAVRRLVSRQAEALGLSSDRGQDLVLAVNEIATNSLRHGGGAGTLRIWRDGGGLICEVSDQGRISDPLVGRQHPSVDSDHGRGIWLANHVCDLVQLQSSWAGTVVRLHMGSA